MLFLQNYSFIVHTPVYIGRECVLKNASVFDTYGKKAYIITSDFGTFRNHALEDMKQALESREIEYRVNSSVISNPPVESVKEIADDCRAWHPDFLVAVGGGSSLDTAKGVSVLLPHPDEDPYTVFWGSGTSAAGRHTTIHNESTIPILMAPTTAGTGSEVTAGAVLTRADLDTKITIFQNVFCEVAFFDPRYIAESPRDLLHAGVMDALSHVVESYVNVKSNPMTRAVGEIGMRMFSQFKDRLLTDELTEQDYQDMLIASYFDGIAFQCGTALPHGMGYPLSHHKGVLHGLACAVFLGEYLRAFHDQSIVRPVVERCGFADVDEFAGYIRKFMEQDLDFTVTEAEIEEYVEQFCSQESHRLKRHPEPITREEISGIFHRSLAGFVKK